MLLFNELKWYLLGAFEKGVMWVLRGGGGMAELHPRSEYSWQTKTNAANKDNI